MSFKLSILGSLMASLILSPMAKAGDKTSVQKCERTFEELATMYPDMATTIGLLSQKEKNMEERYPNWAQKNAEAEKKIASKVYRFSLLTPSDDTGKDIVNIGSFDVHDGKFYATDVDRLGVYDMQSGDLKISMLSTLPVSWAEGGTGPGSENIHVTSEFMATQGHASKFLHIASLKDPSVHYHFSDVWDYDLNQREHLTVLDNHTGLVRIYALDKDQPLYGGERTAPFSLMGITPSAKFNIDPTAQNLELLENDSPNGEHEPILSYILGSTLYFRSFRTNGYRAKTFSYLKDSFHIGMPKIYGTKVIKNEIYIWGSSNPDHSSHEQEITRFDLKTGKGKSITLPQNIISVRFAEDGIYLLAKEKKHPESLSFSNERHIAVVDYSLLQ